MRTPKDFDYDLWTTKDGKNMVRVKATGEVTEVSREIMKLLRAEEKRHRREMEGVPIYGCKTEKATLLSLDFISLDNNGEGCDGIEPWWLIDHSDNPEEILLKKSLEEEFLKTLTTPQCDIYFKCLYGGQTIEDYADSRKINYKTAWESREKVRTKFKKIFGDE